MPRPHCPRRVGCAPTAVWFKPAGVPLRDLEEVILTLDEFEALRLADLEGLYQEAAALRMSISRATFGRIVEAARRKVAEALVHGKALRIEGGPIMAREVGCEDCAGTPVLSDESKPVIGPRRRCHHGARGGRKKE